MPSLAKVTRPKTFRAVARESLFAQLDELRRYPIIWVDSPPGAGKTTAISSYIETRKLKSAWYQLDKGDDDIATFFFYLRQVLSIKGKGEPLPTFLPEHRADLTAFASHFFRSFFDRRDAPSVLCLDNYHELGSNSPLHSLLVAIAKEIPDGCTLIVISRSIPPEAAKALIVSGALTRLGWQQLQFTLEETKALVATHSEQAYSEVAIRKLHTFTGGWAAGVSLSIRNVLAESRAADMPVAADSKEALFAYFATQILQQTPTATRDFLLRTSLLPSISAVSAQAFAGAESGIEILDDLYKRGLFTSRRSTSPPVYQYHDLFRAYLQEQLLSSITPAQLTAYRAQAATVLEQQSAWDAAIELYLANQEWGHVKRLVMQVAPKFLADGRSETLRDYLQSLPQPDADEPWMLYWLGAALARLDPVKARLPLDKAWHALRDTQEPELKQLICADMILSFAFEFSDFSPLEKWGRALVDLLESDVDGLHPAAAMHVNTAALSALGQRLPLKEPSLRCIRRITELFNDEDIPSDLRALAAGFVLVHQFSAGFLRASAVIAQHLQTLTEQPALSPVARAISQLQLGHYALRTGELEKAKQSLLSAQETASKNALNLPMLQVFTNLGLAFAAIEAADLQTAESYREAMASSTSPDRKLDQVGMLRIHFLLAFHRQQWDLALVIGERQLALAQACGIFIVVFESHILMAFLLARLKNETLLRQKLQEIEELLRDTCFSHLRYQCDLALAYFYLWANDEAKAALWLEKGLREGRTDESRFMLRLLPQVFSELLAVAIRTGFEKGYAQQLIGEMRLPAPSISIEEWPWPIRVYTLGRFEVQRNRLPLEFSRKQPKKTLAILKVLIAAGNGSVREQRLLDTFWPDEEGDVAVRSLTAALHRLRNLLGDDEAIVQSGGQIALNSSRVWVDAMAFEALTRDSNFDVEAILHLYRGNFLLEDEGEPWSVPMRERLKSRFIQAVSQRAERLEQAGDHRQALACYQRGVDVDPLVEVFYQGLMRCYAALGQRAEAVLAYRQLKHLLSVTLSLKPSSQTESLYQRLRLD